MNSNLKELNINEEFYFQWHITEKCNLRCQHCYHKDYSSDNELGLADLIKIAKKIDTTLKKWGKIGSLSITGGEPFLLQEKLFNLLEEIDNLSSLAYFDVLTNGSLLDQIMVNKLKIFKKLRRVQLSMEAGHKEINDKIRGEGSFEKTLSSIRLLKENNFKVAVMMTVNQVNKEEIAPLIEIAKKERVDTFCVERFIPEGKGNGWKKYTLSSMELKDIFENLYRLALESNGTRILLYRPLLALCNPDDPTVGAMCSVGVNALTIMHDGTIYPCRLFDSLWYCGLSCIKGKRNSLYYQTWWQ